MTRIAYTLAQALGTAAAVFAALGALILSIDGAYSGSNVAQVRAALLFVGLVGFLLAAAARYGLR